MPERDVHLLLSSKAAQLLDQILELSHMSFDGPTSDHIDEDSGPIIAAIRADIAEQLPARGGKVKKTRTKKTATRKAEK